MNARTVSTISCVSIAMLLCSDHALARRHKSSSDAASVYAELTKAPAKDADRSNPLESDPEAIPAGDKLFHMHCAECHGAMAEGGKKAPSLMADDVQKATPGSLFWLLTNGVVRRGMPVWSKLPESQRWQLVSYLKSLSGPSKPLPGQGDTKH
ncbi:MAG: c-type cytochrome [Candidatus Sulfotelmatobacter sp.]